MQGATKKEKSHELDSFILDDLPKRDDWIVLDRSTLERAANCPFQAAAIEQGRVNNNSLATAAGQECHEAFSKTIRDWIETEGALEPHELRSALVGNLNEARPDVQPAVIAGAKASVYDFAKFLWKIHPGNILRFDGGADVNRCGQLATDIEPKYRITSELDLLYSGESPELLHELDYKCGWKIHTAAEVANSFQFNLHALLVFENYEAVNGLEVRVWNTRTNQQTFRVTFYRDRMASFRIRLLSAIASYEQNVRGPEPPYWPAEEKCSLCPAASLCPVSGDDVREVATDPRGSLRRLIALDAKADAWRKLLAAHVDATGQDILDGDAGFGRNKPASGRKLPVSIYKATKEETAE